MKKLQEDIVKLRSKRDEIHEKKASKKLLLEKKQSVYETLSKFGGKPGSSAKNTSILQKPFVLQEEQTEEVEVQHQCTNKAETLLKVRFMILPFR